MRLQILIFIGQAEYLPHNHHPSIQQYQSFGVAEFEYEIEKSTLLNSYSVRLCATPLATLLPRGNATRTGTPTLRERLRRTANKSGNPPNTVAPLREINSYSQSAMPIFLYQLISTISRRPSFSKVGVEC